MSEWKDKSDFEINKAVAKLLGLKLFEGSVTKKTGDKWVRVIPSRNFDPCNNWADAGPITDGNKISIEYRGHKSLKPVAKRFGSNSHNIADENVLRAAMIVYLEMNGVKP